MQKNIGIILLAAGASRRMGQPKQLLAFQGETLIQRICRIALSTSCRPLVVVLGANATLIKGKLDTTGLEVVQNAAWQEGMGSSVKVGITKLLEVAPGTKAVIFLLVDQPLVHADLLQQLIHAYEKTDRPIIASAYNQTLGVPVLFDQAFFPQLQTIRADSGARFLIKQQIDQVEKIPFPAGALDIDRPEDWERFKKTRE